MHSWVEQRAWMVIAAALAVSSLAAPPFASAADSPPASSPEATPAYVESTYRGEIFLADLVGALGPLILFVATDAPSEGATGSVLRGLWLGAYLGAAPAVHLFLHERPKAAAISLALRAGAVSLTALYAYSLGKC